AAPRSRGSPAPSRGRLRPSCLQRRLEADADGGRMHVALEAGRVGRLDAQQHERGAVAGAQETGAVGDLLGAADGARHLDAGADGDLLEIDAEAGMALLIAGLAVMAVIDADDRKIG